VRSGQLEIRNYDGMIEAVRRGTGLALISETASARDVTSGRLAIVRAPGPTSSGLSRYRAVPSPAAEISAAR
jgi:DNA-binding transcriptional LysR family regulator